MFRKVERINLSKDERSKTLEEIKVYSDIIDQVYNIYYCHLEATSPKEYKFAHDNVTTEELEKIQYEYDQYLKKFNNMLDSCKITAIVLDSLVKLSIPIQYLSSNMDSLQRKEFEFLKSDTLNVKPSVYFVDSLKSKKIQFESIPTAIQKRIDCDSMPWDSCKKYYEKIESYYDGHYGKRIGNRYYIGLITMSRVKFNLDKSLCILECGYQAHFKCGYGDYYLLRKINGKWKIIKKIGSWLS